jgi:hypothetical protein
MSAACACACCSCCWGPRIWRASFVAGRNSAGFASTASALITPSASVKARLRSTSRHARTLPFASTGIPTAALICRTASRSAGPTRRCCALPRVRPCTVSSAQPARSSRCAKAMVSATLASKRILQKTGINRPLASFRTSASTCGRTDAQSKPRKHNPQSPTHIKCGRGRTESGLAGKRRGYGQCLVRP